MDENFTVLAHGVVHVDKGSIVAVQDAAAPPPPGFEAVKAIATEGTLFIGLLASYFFLWASSSTWPQGGIEAPDLFRISIFTVVLLGSSIPIFVAEWANARGRHDVMLTMLFIAFVMGAVFLANQIFEYRGLDFGWRDNAYASLFYVIIGLHALHVLAGLMMNATVQLKTVTGRVSAQHHTTPEVFALYWHFVDGVWIFVFTSLFLLAHAIR